MALFLPAAYAAALKRKMALRKKPAAPLSICMK
jgi:hypothetical protein